MLGALFYFVLLVGTFGHMCLLRSSSFGLCRSSVHLMEKKVDIGSTFSIILLLFLFSLFEKGNMESLFRPIKSKAL